MLLLDFHGLTVQRVLGFLIVELQKSHTYTPHSVGFLWTSDRPVAETATYT